MTFFALPLHATSTTVTLVLLCKPPRFGCRSTASSRGQSPPLSPRSWRPPRPQRLKALLTGAIVLQRYQRITRRICFSTCQAARQNWIFTPSSHIATSNHVPPGQVDNKTTAETGVRNIDRRRNRAVSMAVERSCHWPTMESLQCSSSSAAVLRRRLLDQRYQCWQEIPGRNVGRVVRRRLP